MLALNQELERTHQSHSTACRYLLRQLLSSISATNDNDWWVLRSMSGAPHLLLNGKPSTLNTSLPHSANRLVAGVAHKAQIGVDI